MREKYLLDEASMSNIASRMDVTSGVYPKLKCPTIPWEDKISLASLAWESDKCQIPNKRQVLLDWVYQEIIDAYRKESRLQPSSSEVTGNLWQYLAQVLGGLVNTTLGETASVTIKPQLLQVFTDVFSQALTAESELVSVDSIKCCKLILSSHMLSASLLTKFEGYVAFLSSLLTRFVAAASRDSDDMISLLQASLFKYISLQRRQTNHKKLFERVCEHLLGALLQVHHIIENQDKKIICASIKMMIVTIIKDAFFRRDHLLEYPLALKTLKEERDCRQGSEGSPSKKSRQGSYPKQLFYSLKVLLTDRNSNEDLENSVIEFIPNLLKEFLQARRANNQSCASFEFQFVTELFSLLGVGPDGTDRDDTTALLHLVHDMLSTVLRYNVYQVAEDNGNGATHLHWLLSLAKSLLAGPLSCQTFSCLGVLLNLNHCIIEHHLDTILTQFWMTRPDVNDDLLDAQDAFMASLIKTYSKLRQFDKLLRKLLSSLRSCTSLACNWMGFRPLFMKELVKLSGTLPFGLSASSWTLLCDELETNYVGNLQDMLSSQKSTTSSLSRFVSCLKRLVALLRVFLLNCSFGGIAEQHKTSTNVQALSALYRRTVDNVVLPLFDLYPKVVKKEDKRSMEASSLVLVHTVKELEMFLKRFNLLVDLENCSASMLTRCMAILDEYQKEPSQGEAEKCYLRGILYVQEIRSRLIEGRVDKTCKELYSSVLSCIGEGPPEALSAWNEQVWSINQSNLPVAIWHVISTYASILLPQCEHQQKTDVIQYLIQSLSTDKKDMENESSNGCMTVNSISRRLIQSADFHEIPGIQTAFVSSLWQQIGKLFKETADTDDVSRFIRGLGSDDSEKVLSALPTDWFKNAVKTMENTSTQSFSHELLLQLQQKLTVLTFLPLDWLTDSNHVTSVLGLICCDVLLQNARTNEESNLESLTASNLCRQLLSVILNGCISRKRYLIQEYIDMDGLLTFILKSVLQNTSSQAHDLVTDEREYVSSSTECLCTAIRFTLKNASRESTITELTTKVNECLKTAEDSVEKSRRKSLIRCIDNNGWTIRIASNILLVLSEVISHKTSRLNEVKMAATLMSSLAPPFLSLLSSITTKQQNRKRKHSEPAKHAPTLGTDVGPVIQQIPSLLDSYTSILHVYSVSQNSKKLLHEKKGFNTWQWRKFFPFVLEFALVPLQDVGQTVASVTDNDEKPDCTSHYLIKTCLRFLSIVSSSPSMWDDLIPNEFPNRLLTSLLSCLCTFAPASCDTTSVINRRSTQVNVTKHRSTDLRKDAIDCVLSLLRGSEPANVTTLLQQLFVRLNHPSTSTRYLNAALQVWSALLSSKFPKEKKQELRPFLSQVLVALQSIVQLQNKPRGSLSLLDLSIEVMVKILALGSGMIQPHHAAVVMHTSLMIELMAANESFSWLFLAQYSLLSTALYHQSEAVYGSVHVFVACVRNILRGLLKFCDERSDIPKSGNTDGERTKCAKKMGRLYQEIATHKSTFSKYSPYLIAEYIQAIQEVSLSTNVKSPCSSSPCPDNDSCMTSFRNETRPYKCVPSVWKRQNEGPVCFGARGNSFARFFATKSGEIRSFRFVHHSGQVRCGQNTAWSSYWGCRVHNNSNIMFLYLTNGQNQEIFPKNGRTSYLQPGLGNMDPVLELPAFTPPLLVTAGQEFRVWYGEDLLNVSEGGNSGTTCCFVYAEFL